MVDLDLLGQLQPAAPLEGLLGEEDLDVAAEFLPVGLGEPRIVAGRTSRSPGARRPGRGAPEAAPGASS